MIRSIYAIGAALIALQNPVPATTGPLTMDQAVAIAERNAFTVRIQASNVEKSRQKVTETRGGMGPKVNLTAVYTRFDEATTAQLDPNSAPIIVSPIDSKVGTLSLSVPLDISGNLSRNVRASEANYRATQENLRAALNDTRLNARQAFLSVLRAQALVGVQEQAVKDANERLNQGRLLLAGEQVARVDVTRLEAAVAQAKSDLLTAQNSLQISKYAFNQALARPIETPVDLTDITELPVVPSETDRLVQTGQKNRPEVLSLRQTLTALSNVTRATEASMNPSLSVGVSTQRSLDAAGFSARSQTTSGNLTLNLPIFDSGVTRARVKQARQDEEQAKINLQQVELAISQDVRNAVQNLASAQARLSNAREQVRLAEEVFRLAQIRQMAAEGTYVEVVDAETSLTQARNGLVSSRYDYLVAYSQLERALGTDNVNGAAQEPGSPTPAGGSR